jgi:hypothetical protein
MTRTGLQVITDALKLIGVVAGHEVPTSAEQQDSLARLNEMIDQWGTHAQTMYVPRRVLVPLVIGVQTYTVGVGGVINYPAPMTIDAASYLTTASVPTEVSLELSTDQAYVGQPMKTLTGAPPQAVSYTRGAPLGEIWVWPVPSVATTLVLYWREPVQQFPDLTTPVDLLPGYAKALRTNLALELAPEFGRVVDPMVDRLARESLADIKRANVPYMEVGMDAALVDGGGYNILVDG